MSYTDDELLEKNENLRQSIISKLVEKEIPADTESLNLLSKLLDSSDRSAISRKRIKVDSKANDNQERVLALAQMILKQSHGRDTFKSIDGEEGEIKRLEVIPEEEITIVEGELDIGIENNEYNSFMGKNKKG